MSLYGTMTRLAPAGRHPPEPLPQIQSFMKKPADGGARPARPTRSVHVHAGAAPLKVIWRFVNVVASLERHEAAWEAGFHSFISTQAAFSQDG